MIFAIQPMQPHFEDDMHPNAKDLINSLEVET